MLLIFYFVGLAFLYSLTLYKNDKGSNPDFRKCVKYLIFFLLYYFIFFSFLVPIFKQTNYSTFVYKFIKSRQTIYSFALFIMVYTFYLRSRMIFFRVFLFTSIIIIILFLITLTTGIEILPITKFDRHFIKVERVFLDSYGLMPILIPIGVILIVFKIKINLRIFILAGFGLMFLAWLLSLTRRHIFGTVIYFFLASIIYNYFQKKALIPIGKFLSILVYASILGFFIYLAFPKYAEAGVVTVEETIYVLEHGEDRTGRKDERFSFKRKFLMGLIEKNPMFGTGFDNRWRTGRGDSLGYEAADYPFIAAGAMMGIFGILVFLPIYLVLVRSLYFDFKFLRNNNIDYNSINFLIFMTFILFFVFDLIQYMNWFRAVSSSTDHEWYMYLGLYMASRYLFYNDIHVNKGKQTLIND